MRTLANITVGRSLKCTWWTFLTWGDMLVWYLMVSCLLFSTFKIYIILLGWLQRLQRRFTHILELPPCKKRVIRFTGVLEWNAPCLHGTAVICLLYWKICLLVRSARYLSHWGLQPFLWFLYITDAQTEAAVAFSNVGEITTEAGSVYSSALQHRVELQDASSDAATALSNASEANQQVENHKRVRL